jgi:hypothetical protein
MPNWVTNTVKIVSTEDVIDQLEEHKLSFNHFVPRPVSEEENWYNWNCENWGTKWDIDDDISMDRNDEETLTTDFATAWSPPLKFFENLAKLFDKIYIECHYVEESMGFKGFMILTKCNNELKIQDFTWTPPYTSEAIDNLNIEQNISVQESIYEAPKKEETNETINIQI